MYINCLFKTNLTCPAFLKDPQIDGVFSLFKKIFSEPLEQWTTYRPKVISAKKVSWLLPIVSVIVFFAFHLWKGKNQKNEHLEALNIAKRLAEQEISNIKDQELRNDIYGLVENIYSDALRLHSEWRRNELEVLDDLFEHAAFEIQCISLELQELRKLSGQEQLLLNSSSQALEWQKKILSAMRTSQAVGNEFQSLLEEGCQNGFLNQRFLALFGGTVFHHIAKISRYQPYLSEFISAGADLALRDNYGNTGLMWSIANANNESAMEILNHTETHQLSREYLDVQCDLHKNTALHLAIGKGYVDRSFDKKPLKISNMEIAKKMISLKANVNLPNKDGNTPLHIASIRRDPEMITMLLQAGARPEMVNNEGKTPRQLLDIGYAEACEILKTTVSSAFLLPESQYKS